jgi:alpha-beta hydrolase superfamily lysophospholipase
MNGPDMETGFFYASDGKKLFYRCNSPRDHQDRLIILHGHGEHSGRYVKFFDRLLPFRGMIAASDMRGQGHSEGRQGHIDDFDDLLADVSAFITFLNGRFGAEKNIVLLGHSFGGLVAVHWALRNPGKLRKLILSAPCLGLKLPRPLVAFNRLLDGFAPQFIYRNPVYPPFLTHDSQEIRRYKADPMIRRKISVRLVSEMLSYAAKLEAVKEVEFPFPFYMLLAGDEKIVDGAKSLKFYEKVRAPQKRLEIYSGYYHEIFNEVGQDKVFETLKKMLMESMGP